jgi:3,4-dihydroxy 2-butanone 4-phosphate synthase / GTP cyclohydrolase II
MIAYESEVAGGESHLALVKGDVDCGDNPVLVRVHSHCLTGDVFGATLCDCHSVVQRSLQAIAEAGCGALIYLHNTSAGFEIDRRSQPGRLIFHRNPRGARHEEHEAGFDAHGERSRRTLREVGLGGQILSDLKISKIRLLSNTPTHVPALEGFGLEIVEQVPVPGEAMAGVRS